MDGCGRGPSGSQHRSAMSAIAVDAVCMALSSFTTSPWEFQLASASE